jgi:hypothetical protein
MYVSIKPALFESDPAEPKVKRNPKKTASKNGRIASQGKND